MSKQEDLYRKIGLKIKGEQSQMFGKPCFKINGKAFMCFFNGDAVFKLADNAHKDALSLDGSQLFDPSGKGRAMKEWVQVTYDYKDQWGKFAKAALNYVNSQK